jgi:hypothetical protein
VAQLSFVLSEVEALSREHLDTNRYLEVFVRERSIAIKVKLGERSFELLVSDVHTPELEEISELIFTNLACFAHIHILECFADGFPLELHLFKDLQLNVCS